LENRPELNRKWN